MKVGLLSYPMLFQNKGGLQIQILETSAALRRLGIEARLVDPVRERLTDFDLIHVFSAINGNHRIVECARDQGLPVIVSPLIRPHWTTRLGWLAQRLESVVGRLTQWNVKTEYQAIASCLRRADVLIALGDPERRAIIDAFHIAPERIRVVPNGIPPRFFKAEPQAFCERYAVPAGFVLSVATISPHKNQLAVARALEGTGRQLVLIGPCGGGDEEYMERLLALEHVKYIGALDYESPLLASAYVAAGVFCLPALSEVMPLSVMESLAAGTPVVMTRNHCMDVSRMGEVVAEVSPQDETAIREAVERFARLQVAPEACRAAVAHFSWDTVAAEIALCYEQALTAAERVAEGDRLPSALRDATPPPGAREASSSMHGPIPAATGRESRN